MPQIQSRFMTRRTSPEITAIQARLEGLPFSQFFKNQRVQSAHLAVRLANDRDMELQIRDASANPPQQEPADSDPTIMWQYDGHNLELVRHDEPSTFRIPLQMITGSGTILDGAIACLDYIFAQGQSTFGRDNILPKLTIPADWIDHIFFRVYYLSGWPHIGELELVFRDSLSQVCHVPTARKRSSPFRLILHVILNYDVRWSAEQVKGSVAWLKVFLWRCVILRSHEAGSYGKKLYLTVDHILAESYEAVLEALKDSPAAYDWSPDYSAVEYSSDTLPNEGQGSARRRRVQIFVTLPDDPPPEPSQPPLFHRLRTLLM